MSHKYRYAKKYFGEHFPWRVLSFLLDMQNIVYKTAQNGFEGRGIFGE